MLPWRREALASVLLGAFVVVSCVLPPAKVDEGAGGGGAGGSGAFGGGGNGGGGGGGGDCSNAEECGDVDSYVCDPATATCQTGCTTTSCAGDEICVPQSTGAAVGACYTSCYPLEACANGGTCNPSFDGAFGVCWPAGAGEEGQGCSPTDVSSGCVQGLLCAADGAQPVCRFSCDFWGGSPFCPQPQLCDVSGRCVEEGQPVPVDEICYAAGTPCGNGAYAWMGICATDNVCRRVCRVNNPSDCTASESCIGAAGETVGLCF